jgi:uncharacterized protein (DUF983 family)
MNKQREDAQELLRCSVCDIYLEGEKGFICPRCRRGPLCKSHRVLGRRECASCVFEMQRKDLNDLKTQEHNLRSFLRLLQFLFIVFAIFFIALKTGIPEVLNIVESSVITMGIKYVGGLSVAGYVLFYGVLLVQRRKIAEMESEMSKVEFRRMVK